MTKQKKKSLIFSTTTDAIKNKNGTKDVIVTKDSFCAPHRLKQESSYLKSCFNSEQIRTIAMKYNEAKRNDDLKTRDNTKSESLDLNLDTAELWQQIENKLKKYCDDETCWLELPWFKPEKQFLESSFKPIRPGPSPRKWLSSTNILEYMQQLEKTFEDFKFFGPLPRDFISIGTELARLSISKIYNDGSSRIGIIFNLDRHHQPGSHWTSSFIDLTTNPASVEYFDSVGEDPPNDLENRGVTDDHEIQDFLQEALTSIKRDLGKEANLHINHNTHQRKDTECGVYSIYYITSRLSGRTFKEITRDIKDDDTMFKFREVFFRPIPKKPKI